MVVELGMYFHSFPQSTIRALEGQQSAVHCLSSICGKNFPQNSLVLALFLLLHILFASMDLQIKNHLHWYVSRPGWATPSTRFNAIQGMGWASASVIARLSIWLSIWLSKNSSSKIKEHSKDCSSSTVSAFQILPNLYCDRFWQQVLWSEVRALGCYRSCGKNSKPFWERL